MAVGLAKEHDYVDELNYHLCAVVVRGGSVVSVGFNKRNKNGFVDYVSQQDCTGRPYFNTHAEVAAILSVRSKIDLCGCKMYVARVKPTGVGMARPCSACQYVCGRYGMKKLVYTVTASEWGVLKV